VNAIANKTSKKSAALLSSGNPQIAKADGDAPVQAYIAAMPGWKRDIGRRLDALIVRNVPNVRKAVRILDEAGGWNNSAADRCRNDRPTGGMFPRAVAQPPRSAEDRPRERGQLIQGLPAARRCPQCAGWHLVPGEGAPCSPPTPTVGS